MIISSATTMMFIGLILKIKGRANLRIAAMITATLGAQTIAPAEMFIKSRPVMIRAVQVVLVTAIQMLKKN